MRPIRLPCSIGLHVVFVGFLCLPQSGQGAPVFPYSVRHDFRLLPGGNIVPTVTWFDYEHVYVHDPGLRSNFNPAGQPVGHQPDGRDFIAATGQVGQVGFGGPMTENPTVVPAAGLPAGLNTATLAAPLNAAVANARATVNAFGAGGAVTGRVQVDGSVTLNGRKDTYAFSSSRVVVRGGNQARNGRITWRPAIQAGVADGRHRVWDPIDFSIFDLESAISEPALTGRLLEIYEQGDGTFSWDNDVLSFDNLNGSFSFTIDSPYTAQQGVLSLATAGGLVTAASASGIFGGLSLPSIGSSSTFSMVMPSDITLDYNFGDFDGHALSVNLDLNMAGSAQAAIPEPAAFWTGGLVLAIVAAGRLRRVA